MPEVENDLLEAQKLMFNPSHEQKELSKGEEKGNDTAEEVIDDLKNLNKTDEPKAEEDKETEEDLENLETLKDKKEEAKSEKKNWRESYKETDDYKNELRQKDLATYEAKMKELEEIENDEAYKIIKSARAQGKNPLEVIKEIATADYENLSPEDLFMKKLDKYKGKLTEDEIEQEKQVFKNLTPLQKIESTEGIKNELIAQKKEQLSKFESKSQQPSQELVENFDKFKGELDSILNRLEGKIYKGVKYTPSLLAKLESAIMNGKVSPKAYVNPDGTLDAAEALEVAMSLRDFRDLVKTQELKDAESKGRKSVLKERSNVSKGVRNSGMPNASDDDAELKAAQKQMFNK